VYHCRVSVSITSTVVRAFFHSPDVPPATIRCLPLHTAAVTKRLVGMGGGELLCPFVISEAEEGVDDFIILCYTTDGSEETVDYC